VYSFPIVPDFPLLNAILQTLLFFVCPFVIAILLGAPFGMWLFFKRHPLFAGRAGHLFAVTPFPYARAMIYLGLFPILLVLLLSIPGMGADAAVLVLLSLGAIFHLASHLYSGLYLLDTSILEMALASGLDHQAMIRRVLIPMGKNRIIHSLCETALFLLAMQSIAGFVSGIGLAGLAIWSGVAGADWLLLLLCLLLLIPLFLLVGCMSSHYAKKAVNHHK
jgi:ABC-type methionine transport system permease subunit